MQVSNLLSDLTSLRACDHAAALALVNARTPSSQSSGPSANPPSPPELVSQESASEDPDLQRATDLVELHEGVKVKHAKGLDQGLVQARKDVERMIRKLEATGEGGG